MYEVDRKCSHLTCRYPTAAVKKPYNDSMARSIRRWQSQGNEAPTMKIIDLRGFKQYLDEHRHTLDYDIRYDNDVKQYKLSYELLTVGDKDHLIIYDEYFASKVRDTRKWLMDATFAVVPKFKGVVQFLTIMVEKYCKVCFFNEITQ